MTDDLIPAEPTYTLAEAEQILARRECQQEGHDIETLRELKLNGELCLTFDIHCGRCGAMFVEKTD